MVGTPKLIGLAALLFFLAGRSGFAKNSPLAPPPDWSWLAHCAHSMPREEFARLLQNHYARNDAAAGSVEVGEASVRIRTEGDAWQEVPFATGGEHQGTGPARFWRKAAELGPAPLGKPLQGVKIVLDPGHLGGEWAAMEERFFQLGKTRPVAEGDLTLAVAKRLKPMLEKLGAQAVLLRKSDRPVTRQRAKTLEPAAAAELTGAYTAERLRRQSELFFYRISEIRARAQLVNELLKPDVVVCLHMNAEEWGEPEHPVLQPRNHLHAIVNGCYGRRELESDDIRAEMLAHLFGRIADEAVPLSECVVETLAEATGLPPYTYFSNNAFRAGEGPYLYSRNLLANRLYRVPVVFLEPYVMNSSPVWRRVQMGDYSGEKVVDGVPQKSLVVEYATGVAEGLARYFRRERPSGK
ncbi:MAG: N-acetylmuramoyl-L-alanine amidase [Verrucomicrobia bacterium]|nr:MAG: N-acetylmuramoyl-L-alanine amidase [Verrucomicrobiota bacterium]